MKITYLPENINQKDIFNFIVNKIEYKLWSEILHYINKLHENEELPNIRSGTLYLDEPDVKKLEDIGLDFDYVDNKGNNLFSYLCMISSYNRVEEIDFLGDSLDYIASRTKNINIVNKNKENILFYKMILSQAGLGGEKFFELLKQYPQLDIYQYNDNNENLMNYALDELCPYEILNFLIDKNLSLDHVTFENKNLLHKFYALPFITPFHKAFDVIFNNNPSLIIGKHKNKTPIELYIYTYLSESTAVKSSISCWVGFSIDRIAESSLSNKIDILQNLLKYTTEVYEKIKLDTLPNTKIDEMYSHLHSILSYKILEHDLPAKTDVKQKNKI